MATSSAEVPKKPQTAYFLWFNAKREEIQKMVGSKDFGLVGKKGSELWGNASAGEKAPFEAEAARQKTAFEAFKSTPEGQKALEALKNEKKDAKQEQLHKKEEKAKKLEEKQLAKEKRDCKAAVKAVEKDDALKKPPTAYFAWLNDNRAKIAALIGKAGCEVAKKGAEMWKALPEKDRKVYEEAAAKAKEAHDAYLKTPEGMAALKAYKDATGAVAFKEPPKTENSPTKTTGSAEARAEAAGKKRKVEEATTITKDEVSKRRAKAGA